MKFSSLYEELFYKSLRIRLVEEKIVQLYPSDKIQSPVHLSIGQEAVSVGICHSLAPSDLLFGTYRSHALYLAKGGDLVGMFGELYGKTLGCARGKAGSMHLTAPEVGLMGSSAVVASTTPHAVGAALAAKQLGKNHIAVSVFGDGACEEGAYHESLNFAALYRLPVLFICENNGLAVHASLASRQAFDILRHAQTFNIPATRITEGYDFLKIHEVACKLIEQVRRTPGPEFLEIKTFRYKEHVGPGDDFHAGYRKLSDFEQWKSRDPLFTDQALVGKFTPPILEEINQAIRIVENSPWPAQEELLADVL
ncbi:MAG: thiamine pyrophosphate-dependent dehydrogenase E1 component subunit alpha [Candidatus Omnitrophica bacterium]|nr:thiamine pyrophosphate-dependent dehydrogenase E1 component subunit alpha [Candidatus Omnitrophota bacterium]